MSFLIYEEIACDRCDRTVRFDRCRGPQGALDGWSKWIPWNQDIRDLCPPCGELVKAAIGALRP